MFKVIVLSLIDDLFVANVQMSIKNMTTYVNGRKSNMRIQNKHNTETIYNNSIYMLPLRHARFTQKSLRYNQNTSYHQRGAVRHTDTRPL